MVESINDQLAWTKFKGNNDIFIVYCYVKWLPACEDYHDNFSKLAHHYSGKFGFAKFNTEDFEGLRNTLEVKQFPTFIAFMDGKEYQIKEKGGPNC